MPGFVPAPGLYLVPHAGQDGWRVAQERYTRSGEILAVRVNEHVGPLPAELPDRRGRASTPSGASSISPSGPPPRFSRTSGPPESPCRPDADAIGMSVEDYITAVRDQAVANGREHPWASARRECGARRAPRLSPFELR